MKKSNQPTATFHIIHCDPMDELKILLSKKGQNNKAAFLAIGISSREKLRTAMKAVQKSPFKTLFVVSPDSGKVLYAISQNEQYVESAKKRKKGPKQPTPPLPDDQFCFECFRNGGKWCDSTNRICSYEWSNNTDPGMDDTLDTLAPI